MQDVGGAIMFAVSLALLANAFPTAKERGGALAAYGATIGAAFAVGPLVGGALTSGLGWRWIFLINTPLGLACLAVTRAYVVESKDAVARRVDLGGLLTLTGGLFLLILALLRGNEPGWGSAQIVAELGGAGVLLAAFVFIEAKIAEPMLPLGLFRSGSFTGAQVGAFAISASWFAIFGTGLFNPAISNFALSSVPEHQSGLAAGANDTFRQAGIAVGVAGLGALIPSGAIFAGGDQRAFVGGMHDALWVCAAICVVGAAACWALPRDPEAAETARVADGALVAEAV